MIEGRDPVGEDSVGLGAGAADFTDGLDFRKVLSPGVWGAQSIVTGGNHSTVPVGVERIDVSSFVEDGCNSLRVDDRHMVDLGVGLHCDFPVAFEIEDVAVR